MQAETVSDSHNVEAELKYAVGGGGPYVVHASAGGEEEGRTEGLYEHRTVRIADARPLIGALTLDEAGFACVRRETAVSDFYNQAQVKEIYEREVEDLVKDLTGASRTLVFDHTLRSDSNEIRKARQIREYAELVHNDYTERSARRRVRDFLPDEADGLLSGRFAILNLWRSAGGIVDTTPLAFCDARSLAEGDVIAMERRAKDRVGELQQGVFNPDHRWYYFPRMDRDEVLVFKTFDSAHDGRARFCLHSAFRNPAAAPDAQPRESIESRVFAFFDA